MRNCPMDSIEDYDDINTKDQYRTALEAGCTEEEALDACIRYSRDNARTPMQWSHEKEAGFTTGKPWLKVNPNYTEINVEVHVPRFGRETTRSSFSIVCKLLADFKSLCILSFSRFIIVLCFRNTVKYFIQNAQIILQF